MRSAATSRRRLRRSVASNNSSGNAAARYFASAKNQVGLVLAILVVVLHLVVGIGIY